MSLADTAATASYCARAWVYVCLLLCSVLPCLHLTGPAVCARSAEEKIGAGTGARGRGRGGLCRGVENKELLLPSLSSLKQWRTPMPCHAMPCYTMHVLSSPAFHKQLRTRSALRRQFASSARCSLRAFLFRATAQFASTHSWPPIYY